jgi:hypothetical protein
MALPLFSVAETPADLMGVAVFVLVAYTGVLYAYAKNSPESFLRTALDASKTRQQRTDAIDGLAKLAESQNWTISSMAASSLRFALSDAASPETDNTSAVRQAVLKAILKLDRLSDREGMVQELLGKSGLPHDTRKLAVDALQEIGTPAAAAKLKEFVERGALSFRPGRRSPTTRISIFGRMPLRRSATSAGPARSSCICCKTLPTMSSFPPISARPRPRWPLCRKRFSPPRRWSKRDGTTRPSVRRGR